VNTYFHISFLPIYEFIYFRKLIFAAKFKSYFNPFKKTHLGYVLGNYYLLWINIYKPRFYFKKSVKLKYRPQKIKQFKHNRLRAITRFLKNSYFAKNNFLIYFYFNNFGNFLSLLTFKNVLANFNLKKESIYFLKIYKKTIGEGFFYARGLLIIFFIDACVTDDEPLWEPVEWSLVQTWLFFIFAFAWIGENLISSRFGSYTGRDKRVWFAWYKTFWLIEVFYALCYGATSMFVIVPFYYELTYSLSFVFSWWNWYTKVFFFKFISIYTIILLTAYFFQLNIKWMNWKKLMFYVLIINIFIGYLLYTHFIMAFFGYFTDPLWYQKTRFIDYVQLSHEPLKWGWGPAKRDHFTYHRISTVFWFKNDGPFAGAFLMFHLYFFLCVFFLYVYWLVLLRRIYTTKEVTYTFSTYCVSALKQFFYFFLLMYVLIFISFIVCYWRYPVEFFGLVNATSWAVHFGTVLNDYIFFLGGLL
jgi:hypothetical protein